MTERDRGLDDDSDPSPPDDRGTAAAPPVKGSNQTLWVGVFLILGILAGLAALFILTDAAIFRGRYIVTTHVPNAGGIRRGDPVQMLGVNIGRVQRFKIDHSGVAIRLELEGEYDVPKDSHILLKSSGLLGGMIADIVPGDSKERLRNGDTIAGQSEEAMMDIANRVTVQVEAALERVQRLMSDPNIASIGNTTRNLESGSGQMRKLLGDMNVAVNDQRRELKSLTASLQRSAEGFEKVATGPEVERTLKQVDAAAARMDTVMASLERTSTAVEGVMGRVDRGEGTLGKLMRDEELYRNMNAAMLNMNQATVNVNKLSEEVRRDPRKYLKLSVF
jgi:phospholipid/cholesterol/gamma-HCH transport system substrate-binding protein